MARRKKRSGGGGEKREGGRKTRSRGGRSAHGKPRTRGTAKTRAVIAVDGRSIRQAAINKCKYILRQFDKVAGELEKYDTVDLPAHRSWYFRSFGPRLSELRELEEEVHSYRALLQEIRHLIVWKQLAPQEACRIAEDARRAREQEQGDEGDFGEGFAGGGDEDFDSGWDRDDDEFEDDFGDDFDDSGGISEEELFALFSDMLRAAGYLEFDPDSDIVRLLYEQFKASFGFGEEHSGAADDDEPTGSRRSAGKEPGTSADRSDAIVRERLKSLYRQMAKELHPDNRDSDGDELREGAASDLWHRVQEAYAAEDLDELQMLAAQHSIRRRNNFAGLPVSRILAVHRDRKEELRWIRRRHREARKSAAWGFTDLPETGVTELHRIEEDALSEQISALRSRKAEMVAKLESYRNPVSTTTRNRVAEAKERDLGEGQLSLF